MSGWPICNGNCPIGAQDIRNIKRTGCQGGHGTWEEKCRREDGKDDGQILKGLLDRGEQSSEFCSVEMGYHKQQGYPIGSLKRKWGTWAPTHRPSGCIATLRLNSLFQRWLEIRTNKEAGEEAIRRSTMYQPLLPSRRHVPKWLDENGWNRIGLLGPQTSVCIQASP